MTLPYIMEQMVERGGKEVNERKRGKKRGGMRGIAKTQRIKIEE